MPSFSEFYNTKEEYVLFEVVFSFPPLISRISWT